MAPKETVFERAVYEGELVTVLQRGRTKTEVRTALGFVKEVRNRDLAELPEGDDRRTFTVKSD